MLRMPRDQSMACARLRDENTSLRMELDAALESVAQLQGSHKPQTPSLKSPVSRSSVTSGSVELARAKAAVVKVRKENELLRERLDLVSSCRTLHGGQCFPRTVSPLISAVVVRLCRTRPVSR